VLTAPRVSRTFRLRQDLGDYIREQAESGAVTQTAILERALLRDLQAERRRIAQQAAIEDSAENRQLAESTMGAAQDLFLADE